MGYTIKLSNFEGSFDLLYHLISREKLNIWEISLAQITRQYLAYLQDMDELDIETTSDFLVMAATLLRLKSRMLLPLYEEKEETENDEMLAINTKEELFERILEYRSFKNAAEWLREREHKQNRIFLRPKKDSEGKNVIVIKQDTLYPSGEELLGEAWQKMQEKIRKKLLNKKFKIPEAFNFKEKIRYILSYLRKKGQAYFHLLCPRGSSKKEVIASFLAILELASKKRVILQQNTLFGSILVTKRVKDEG